MDSIILGFENIAHFNVLLALVAGAFIGILIGAVPGLEPAGAMAILLPFTLGMEPLAGVTLLLGTYGGAWYGGAIPAILIKVPGTPVNVLTTYDGYPMAQRGEAYRALSLAYSSSFIGGTISVVALVVLAPYLATIAAHFGAVEYAMVALVAIVSVLLAHQSQGLMAIISLGFGILLGTVGFERFFNTQRFTFGEPFLMGGIPLVPAVIGLFAMSQAFVLLRTPGYKQAPPSAVDHNRFRGLLEALRYPRTLGRSAGLGVTMGLLPGVGEFGAQFLSYSLAKRASKTPEQFGKGSPEGLIASEASISACTSTTLVPLLALGIPVDPLMAMILSVFMIHNYIPGPQLFAQHPEFISGLYLSLFLLNIVILGILLFATKPIMKLARIEPRFIGMTVLVLSLVGCYTQNYRISDALIAVVFAIIGKIMLRNDIPGFPLVIGLVLGPLFENRMMQSLALSNGDLSIFVTRPIAAVLLAVSLLGLGIFAVGLWRARPAAAPGHPVGQDP
ncbi:tripartite tricarboxylate transporter permease [Shinella sp.]|uniref:tripartite tricarboxylate transporter permease n=1 Tax=Shinella sp. TaxID=1870904 RepID=UPI0029AC84AF|nr:tripartite tricarboxylate transporter permease [Shinella sp.]MDX3974082.1 tripartite tricarboxylate transporter permease [Shinella sp.]